MNNHRSTFSQSIIYLFILVCVFYIINLLFYLFIFLFANIEKRGGRATWLRYASLRFR